MLYEYLLHLLLKGQIYENTKQMMHYVPVGTLLYTLQLMGLVNMGNEP